jgi:hypothetical protein
VVAAARDRHHHSRGVAREGGAEARVVPGEVGLARTEFQLRISDDPPLRKNAYGLNAYGLGLLRFDAWER